MKWFADYLESRDNRYKLARRLCAFVVVGSIVFTLIILYYGVFLKK